MGWGRPNPAVVEEGRRGILDPVRGIANQGSVFFLIRFVGIGPQIDQVHKGYRFFFPLFAGFWKIVDIDIHGFAGRCHDFTQGVQKGDGTQILHASQILQGGFQAVFGNHAAKPLLGTNNDRQGIGDVAGAVEQGGSGMIFETEMIESLPGYDEQPDDCEKKGNGGFSIHGAWLLTNRHSFTVPFSSLLRIGFCLNGIRCGSAYLRLHSFQRFLRFGTVRCMFLEKLIELVFREGFGNQFGLEPFFL
jgi:hypothetical protein